MFEEEVRQTYTLNCDGCGGVFENSSAFPQPQLCPECLKPEVKRAKPEYDASITQLPDPFEPKADESKDLEMSKQVWKFSLKGHADECDTDAVVDHIVSETASIKDLECQKRVERLFEEIEAKFEDVTGKGSIEQILAIPKYKWQALKKRQEVK